MSTMRHSDIGNDRQLFYITQGHIMLCYRGDGMFFFYCSGFCFWLQCFFSAVKLPSMLSYVSMHTYAVISSFWQGCFLAGKKIPELVGFERSFSAVKML